MIDETRIEQVRTHLDIVLQLLREERDIRDINKQYGGRELSEAITNIETGSMWAVRSLYADQPYTPKLKLTAAADNTVPVSEQMKRTPAEKLEAARNAPKTFEPEQPAVVEQPTPEGVV